MSVELCNELSEWLENTQKFPNLTHIKIGGAPIPNTTDAKGDLRSTQQVARFAQNNVTY